MKRSVQLAVACVAVLVTTTGQMQAGMIDLSGASSGTLINAPGGSFAQTFTGQSVSGINLLGSPTSPLSLSASGSITVASFNPGVSPSSNSLLPQPGNTAPLSILLDSLADSITFTAGAAGPPSSIQLDFFDASGGLVANVIQPLSSGYAIYSFSGLGDFRGLSISANNDGGGLRYQNFSFNEATPAVPEPSTFALLGIGGIALVGYGYRRKRQQAA